VKRTVFAALLTGISSLCLGQSVPFTSSDLPIIVINTGGRQIFDEPKVMVSMGIIYNGPGVTNNITDPFNNYNGKIGIELRGSSSQMFPKKQYAIELWDNDGKDIKQSLLGLPEEGDWILFAPYNDKSLMRDALAYTLTRAMGRYASRVRFAELVMDGDYKGVYVLLEKIKRNEARVDIADLNTDENSGDELTGGYIIKLDKTSGGNGSEGFTSAFPPPNRSYSQSIYFQYEYPKIAEMTAQQKTYIRNFMASFESALNGPNWQDPQLGYEKYINLSSFIDYFIINELSKNVDGYRLSTFMYKEKDSDGGKLNMGPVWDFNLGFGNANYCTNTSPNGFVTDFNTICPTDFWLIPFWWNKLWGDTQYRALLYSRWSALREGPFATQKVLGYIDSVATVLDKGAQQRNFQKWPVLGKYIWPNPPDYAMLQTYQSEVNWLKSWVVARLTWLDERLKFVISGVEDNEAGALSIRPYPNPVRGDVTFEYSIPEAGQMSIRLYDALGREAARIEETRIEAGTYTSTASMAPFSAGLYFYQVQFNGRALAGGHLRKSE
jgi:hypothetical protein